MEQRTRLHVATGETNREAARAILHGASSQIIPLHWAAVVGFCAAVHYVNAVIWEYIQIRPQNHDERNAFVSTVSHLRPIRAEYQQLQVVAFEARYVPGYRLRRDKARRLVEHDLEAIRVAGLNALDDSA